MKTKGWIFSLNKAPMEFSSDGSHLPETNEVKGFELDEPFYHDIEFNDWFRFRYGEWAWVGEYNVPHKMLVELLLLKG